MESFTLRATLTSPVIMRGHCTLDAVLMAVLNTGDVSNMVKCVDDLYYASAAMRLGTGENKSVSFVSSMMTTTKGHIWAEILTPSRTGKVIINPKREREAGSKTDTYIATPCSHVEWYATGDAHAVLDALKGVASIGKKRRHGFGEVSEWSVSLDDELDGLVGVMGEPLRPIPLDRWEQGGDWLKTEAAWKPAYWDVRNRSICVVPETH